MNSNLFFFKLAITGRFRRGKDTLAGIVREAFREDMRELITPLAFADALKREHAAMVYQWLGRTDDFEAFYQWMRERRDINGVGWQWWGEFRRQVTREDFWVLHAHLQRRFEIAQYHRWPMIITDMRQHNEAKWCKENGFYRVRISGPCRAPEDVRDRDHPSERFIDELEVDEEYLNETHNTLDDMRLYVEAHLLPVLREHCDAQSMLHAHT